MSHKLSRCLLLIFVIAGGYFAVRTSFAGGAIDDPKAADSTTALLQRIEQLENRIAALERNQQFASAPREALPVPPNWGSSQINGQTYYIVPLNAVKELPKPAVPVTTDNIKLR